MKHTRLAAVALTAALGISACGAAGAQPHVIRAVRASSQSVSTAPSTTTSTTSTVPPTTTTTAAPRRSAAPRRTEAEPRPQAAVGAASAPLGGGFWLRLRTCESSNNYADTDSSTYRGAYQFTYSTWADAGGHGDPAAAPPGEQDARAQWLSTHANPYHQWPVCWPRAVRGG